VKNEVLLSLSENLIQDSAGVKRQASRGRKCMHVEQFFVPFKNIVKLTALSSFF
jgi:hypothetical protein